MKHTKYALIALAALLSFSACDSFLDRQEDEQLTFEKIWKQRATTRQYFLNCMGYLPNDIYFFYTPNVVIGASDEASMTWTWSYQYVTFGSWNASNLPHTHFNDYYNGIRDCNIYMQNCYKVLEEDDAAQPAEIDLWYASVRWARAYMYFLLMRDFGPVMLVGDEPMDFTASTAELERPRNTWDECVDYVVSEMEWCSQHLPLTHSDNNLGLPTQGAALAVISRLKLYSARALFNGNSLYRTLRNPDGTNLFPTEFQASKWVEAAQAAAAVMDLGQYELYRDESGDPYLSYYGVTQEPWNKEIIFSGGGYQSRYWLGVHTAPTNIAQGTAYGGWGPTQSQVDAYAMAGGRYPVLRYEADGTPVTDTQSGYPAVANEWRIVQVTNPFLAALGAPAAYQTSESPEMYKNREPRFYVNVYYPGSHFKHGSNYGIATFATGGPGHTSHDYPKSGYLVNRFYDPTQDSYVSSAWGNITFPTFRLAEIYLNYIEAVLECELNGVSGAGVDHERAMACWDDIRSRSGVPSILEAYPDATTAQLLDYARRERRVELSQEGLRYYDTRTWMIAPQTDNGPMYGLDTTVPSTATNTTVPAEMWKRSVFENRVFRNNHYLFPFPQRELDRNHQLTQNYGW